MFEALVLAEPGTFEIMEEGHTQAYQDHLYAIRTTYMDLNALPGINSLVASGRPQLSIDPLSPYVSCQLLVDKVNLEVSVHILFPSLPDNAPWAHDPTTLMAAAHRAGEGFDARITGLTQARIDQLANQAGLHRPDSINAPDHYELLGP